jgi:hypothetical protein
VTTYQSPTIEQRITATLLQDTGRIPVVLGLCGAGRTRLLQRLEQALPPGESQYVNVERTATTPERFLAALTSASPFLDIRPVPEATTPRQAFDAVLALFAGARRADNGPVTFLLDEILEFRTFESFPGLRRALPELLAVIAASPNRFVLASRYLTRTERALAGASPQFVAWPMPTLPEGDLERMIAEGTASRPAPDGEPPGEVAAALARLVGSLSLGRPAYAKAIVEAMAGRPSDSAAPDPVAALASLLEPGAALWSHCAFSYELRLHRARGYGALKAILEILSEREPLTLTEVARRLGRTPGSTKDYLSWLEDVDLVSVANKRYRFRDPMLRLWVRLHCHATPPTRETIGREVLQYLADCLT